MKRTTLILALLLMFTTLSFAGETIKYNDSWSSAGFSLSQRTSSGVTVDYSIKEFSLEDIRVNGENLVNVSLPDVLLQNDEGAPNLAGGGRLIALPQGAHAKLHIVSQRTETFSNVEIAPAPRIPLDTDDSPLEYTRNNSIYTKDAFYPTTPVQLGEQTMMRGVDVVMLGITPFQYNPVTKELVVYRDLQVEVEFIGGNGQFGANSLRNRWWDPILDDHILNSESLPVIDYTQRASTRDGADYLIICPDDADFLAWADSIKVFRTQQGIHTVVMTTSEVGGNNTSAIEGFIDDIMDPTTGWDPAPAAVLLMGDYGTTGNTVVSPIYNSYCVSDNIYADVTGNMMPDVTFARMTAQNVDQLETMVTKFLNYERTPPTAADFYDHPITALGWQTERWFQICSEAVGGFFLHEHGKSPVRINAIYSGTPSTIWSTATNTSTVVNKFGPSDLGYIPATPAELGGWSGGNATMVNNAINDGAFILQHRDHGYEQGWGEPSYSSSNIDGLNNSDLPFIFSINCLTGKYNYSSECFAEKFHRYTYNGNNSGALGIIAASEVSYSFVNDTFVWGMYDNMWPEFLPTYNSTPVERGVLPAFANSAGKYFLYASSWPYNTNNKAVTYNLFHHHGDAFTTVYSEVPQDLTVAHDPVLLSGVSTFNVTANAGALIAMSVDGSLIGVAEGTGSPVSVSIDAQVPPTEIDLVITLQNYYRYEVVVPVIPPSGPYVVYDSHVLNDPAGNSNGELDYGETVTLDFTVSNVGSDQANNVDVIISTTDAYVTITDDNADFGNIAAGATATVTDAFEFEVAGDVPDGHVVAFVVEADGGTVWESYFSINALAPVLEYVDFSIFDPTGNNNGKIDPGETVDIEVIIENTGSSESFDIIGELIFTDPFLSLNSNSFDFGDIIAGDLSTASVSATADAATPAGHMVNIDFNAEDGSGYTAEGSFYVVIGQIPILILDLDPDHSSGTVMETTLQDIGVSCEYQTSFPADLSLYSSIFTFLGIYDINHTLTSGEGTSLADFLNNGGYLYMEGGDTWYYDSQTSVHPMFNINGTADGSGDLGPINGQAGTFAENMTFSYSGANNWMDHIEPTGSAFDFFRNQSPDYGCAVAYDEGSYKTIGASFEFGGLDDGAHTKEDLMLEYLYFFDIVMGFNGTVEGVVTDIETGLPIEGADIAGLATSAADGTYSFDFAVGIYDFTCIADGYFDLEIENVEIEEGMVTNLDFAMNPSNPPENVDAEVIDFNDVVITWEAPSDAITEVVTTSRSAKQEQAVRKESNTSDSRALAGFKIYESGTEIIEITDPATFTYTHAALDAGDYDYTVSAVYDNGESNQSDPVSVTVTLPCPIGVTAQSQDPNVIVSWSMPTRAVASYTIYRDGSMIAEDVLTSPYEDLNVVSGTYTYNVVTVYDGGWESVMSDDAVVDHTDAGNLLKPEETKLTGNYPNPFNPTTTIKFSTKEAGFVSLNIYNMKGQLVKTLVNEQLDSAYHNIVWNGKDNSSKPVSSGIYFYKMRTGNYSSTKKMILMK